MIAPAGQFQPTCRVFAARIAMCPVQHATPLVPYVLTGKAQRVADVQIIETRREVDIMGHQQGCTGRQPQQETLMSAAALR